MFRLNTISIVVACAFILLGTIFSPKPSYDGETRNGRQRPTRRSVDKPESRSLASSTSIKQDHATTSSDAEPVRIGSCSEVSYGNYDWSNSERQQIDPKELPLNELLIHLDHPAYVSPPNPDGTVMVDIGLYVFGIADLDPGTNTFLLEGYLDLVWCDARTKFDESEEGISQHVFLEKDAAKEIEHIWWPAVTFVNEVTSRHTENQELIIFSDGTIEYREKFAVQLATEYDMLRFPFDDQVLVAEIESFAWNSNVMEFHIEEDLVGFSDEFSIPEHRLTGIEEHLEIKQEQRDRYPFSELVTEIYVERTPTFYVTKVIVPLVLIVCISWAVFWMDTDDLADRMAISFTGVLTSVAYQFVVSESLPRHIYNTFLDNFVLISFITMVLTVVVNIVVHTLTVKGYVEDARLVDKICRIMFPIMFTASVFLLASAQILADGMKPGGVMGITVALNVGVITAVGIVVLRRIRSERDDNPVGSEAPLDSVDDIEKNSEEEALNTMEEERHPSPVPPDTYHESKSL